MGSEGNPALTYRRPKAEEERSPLRSNQGVYITTTATATMAVVQGNTAMSSGALEKLGAQCRAQLEELVSEADGFEKDYWELRKVFDEVKRLVGLDDATPDEDVITLISGLVQRTQAA